MRIPLTPEARAESLIEALPYIQRFRGQTFVVKYGGAAMEEEASLSRLSTAISENDRSWDGNIEAINDVIDARGAHTWIRRNRIIAFSANRNDRAL